MRPGDFGGISRRDDGSYVIRCGMYHVPQDDPLWGEVHAAATACPDEVGADDARVPPEMIQEEPPSVAAILQGIDMQSIAPLRAYALGVATDDDTARLRDLHAKAEALRGGTHAK